MIGREPEVERLERALAGLRHQGGSVLVRGEPGAGKSAFRQAARALAELEPAIDARLVVVDGTVVTFRHPLVRSAVL